MKKISLLFAAIVASMSLSFSVEVTDVINNAFTGVGNASAYSDWTATGTSGTKYSGQTAGTNTTVQLRSKNNNSGIVSTSSVGIVKSVTVKVNSNTYTGRVLNIYGSNTPFTAATDLYKTGVTPVGTLSCDDGTTLTYTFTEDYYFIGIRSAENAIYLDEISIVWDKSGDVPEFPEAGNDTVIVDVADITADYYEDYSEEGAYNYWLQIEDNNTGYWLLFDLYAATEGDLSGTYTFADETLGEEDTYVYIDEETEIAADDAKLVITATTDGKYKVSGTLLASDGVLYVVDYTGEIEVGVYDPFDSEPQEVTTINFNATAADYDDSWMAYGYPLDLYLVSDNGQLLLEFNVAEVDEETVVPVGEYTIDDSENTGTVLAATIGYFGIEGSYYATDFYTDEEGELAAETAYFVESGKVSVSKTDKGVKIVVSAKTHYGSTINAVYEGNIPSDELTGVENIKLIDSTAPIYNVLGQEVDKNYKGVVIQNGQKYLLQ